MLESLRRTFRQKGPQERRLEGIFKKHGAEVVGSMRERVVHAFPFDGYELCAYMMNGGMQRDYESPDSKYSDLVTIGLKNPERGLIVLVQLDSEEGGAIRNYKIVNTKRLVGEKPWKLSVDNLSYERQVLEKHPDLMDETVKRVRYDVNGRAYELDVKWPTKKTPPWKNY